MAFKLSDVANKGSEAIKKAAEGGGGTFRPFTPVIKWDGGDEKYVMFLLDIEESPVLRIHEWVKCGTKTFGDKEFTDYYFGLDRTDPLIGEDSDPLTDKGSETTTRTLSVAVELEPEITETGKGRKRATSFKVKTRTFERKTDDGTEEVTAPEIGIVTQSQGNFFNILTAHAENVGPIQESAFKVTRVGDGSDSVYQFNDQEDKPVDLSNLIDFVEGITYISRDKDTWDEVEAALAGAADDEEKAHIIAVAVIERRINELADKKLYDEKTGHLDKVTPKYPKNKGGKGKGGEKKARPERTSQRKTTDSGGGDKPDRETRAKRFAEIASLAGNSDE